MSLQKAMQCKQRMSSKALDFKTEDVQCYLKVISFQKHYADELKRSLLL